MLALLLLLATVAALVKVVGAVVGGSKALLIDSLTSIANVVAALGVAHYSRYERVPADADHPYGHYRLSLGGVLVTLMTYSFVAGVGLVEIVHVEPYKILSVSLYYAVAGLLLYLATIAVARRAGTRQLAVYALFTFTEVLESVVTIVAVLGGVFLSWLIDWVGGLGILTYLFIELSKTAKEFLNYVADVAPPEDIIKEIENVATKYGLRLGKLRIRKVTDGVYQGEVSVYCSEEELLSTYSRIRDFEETLRREGIDVCVRLISEDRRSLTN